MTTDVLLFNVSAREEICAASLAAQICFTRCPTMGMADATAQFLTAHRWTRVLLLTGVQAGDAPQNVAPARDQALRHQSDRRQNLQTLQRTREREQGDVALLTAGTMPTSCGWSLPTANCQSVPYRTNQPRLVVGSAGWRRKPGKPRGTAMARSN